MSQKWDLRFMEMARLVASWSKDPSTKVGAVIVDDDHKVLGLGFNGFARGVDDSPEAYADRDSKLGKVIHAEVNAILNAAAVLQGSTLYISSMCCSTCAAVVIQSGIKRIVVPSDLEDPFSYRDRSSLNMLNVKDLVDAGGELSILAPGDYDATLLMGPEHPSHRRAK